MCEICDSRLAPTFYHPSRQTEHSDVILETRFNLVLHTVILHSQVTPERPQIAQAHTNNSQNHAFGTYFSGLCLTIFLQCRLPRSGSISVQYESDSEYWDFISSNQQRIQNLTFQILNSNCKSQYTDTTRMQNPS